MTEKLKLRHRLKGARELIRLAIGIVLSEREAQRFVHTLNLGVEARKREKASATAKDLFK